MNELLLQGLPKIKPGQTAGDLEIYLAEYLLQVEAGARIASVRELADATNMSVGAVSSALTNLQDSGAVQISKRGHLGSFLEGRSVGDLWKIAKDEPLVIAFTIPSNIRFEGLATGLKSQLNQRGIETYLIFIRGSNTRLKALRENRCHAVILSHLTAAGDCCPGETIALRLPPNSWLKGYLIYYRTGKLENGKQLRIGVDPDSYDHRQITELEFADQDVIQVRTNFTQLPRLLSDGRIDATVWNAEEIRYSGMDGISSRPLSARVTEIITQSALSACVVISKGNMAVQSVLREAIDIPELIKIQERVISGELLPEY